MENIKKRSDKSQDILTYINKYIFENGFSPSVREIKNAMNLSSTATVQYYINKLELQGKIHKKNNKNRTICVKNSLNENYSSVPILGNVAAGIPILAVENIENYCNIPQSLFKGENLYMLHVKGDSMINAGIFNGDLIVVEQCYSPKSYDIVVAMIDDEVTVKRLIIQENYIILHPENPKYNDIIIDKNITILGKVIGSIRNF